MVSPRTMWEGHPLTMQDHCWCVPQKVVKTQLLTLDSIPLELSVSQPHQVQVARTDEAVIEPIWAMRACHHNVGYDARLTVSGELSTMIVRDTRCSRPWISQVTATTLLWQCSLCECGRATTGLWLMQAAHTSCSSFPQISRTFVGSNVRTHALTPPV